MTPSLILGIDPGVKGGWAILDPEGNIIDRDSRQNYLRILETPLDDISAVALEKVSNWSSDAPGQALRMSPLIEDYGWWKGWLEGLGLPQPRLVHPQTWRAYFKLRGTVLQGKKRVQPCPVQFVNAVWQPEKPLLKKEDGQAVGILLADYARITDK